MKREDLVRECKDHGIESVTDGTLELQLALEKVLKDPSAVFEVADEIKMLGFHAQAEKLHRNGFAHTKEDGVCKRGGAPAGAVVWGKGAFQRWVIPNEKFFEKDIKRVAKQVLPRRGAAAELRKARAAKKAV
jgi:hypothetical protein